MFDNDDLDIDPEDLLRQDEAITRKWLIPYVDSLCPKRSIPVNLDLAHSKEVNAFAHISQGTYQISINRGLIEAFLIDLFDIYEHDESFGLIMLQHPGSGDPFLDRAGRLLAIKDALLVYITLHELGHIVHGHLDWLASTEGSGRLSQVYRNAVRQPRTFQALEFDADLFAIRHSLLHFPFSRKGDRENFFRRPEVLGAAMALLFNLLADGVTPVCDYDQADHPAPEVRFACVFNLLSGLAVKDDFFQVLSEDQQKQWNAGCFAALFALKQRKRCRLLTETIKGHDHTISVDPQIERYLIVSKRLQELAPDLPVLVQIWSCAQ